MAGLPAFGADGVYLRYTTVDAPAPGAFDPGQRQSVPQSAFWTTGPSTDGLTLYERLTGLDPDGERFGFLPVYTGPDDTEGVPHSGLAPFGDQLLTVAERAARGRTRPATAGAARASAISSTPRRHPGGVQRERRDRGPVLRPPPLLARAAALRGQLVRRAPRRDPAAAPRPRHRRDDAAPGVRSVRGRDRRRQLSLFLPVGSSGRRSRACASPTRGGCGTHASAGTAGAAPTSTGRSPRRAGRWWTTSPSPTPTSTPCSRTWRRPGFRRRGPLSVRRDPRGAHRGPPRRAGAGADRGGFRLSQGAAYEEYAARVRRWI